MSIPESVPAGSAGGADDLGAIGPRLKEARLRAKLSLRDVGARADVTASFLSQVERGNVQPSIVTLHRVCSVLGLSMSEALSSGEPRAAGVYVTRKDKRAQMIPPTHDVTVDMLVSVAGRPFELLMVKLAPGRSTAPDLVSHDAREAMLVIAGLARFESGTFSTDLEVGDTIYLNASMPHRMVNAGETELVFVNCVVGEV